MTRMADDRKPVTGVSAKESDETTGNVEEIQQ
jgi:hypothetical protein